MQLTATDRNWPLCPNIPTSLLYSSQKKTKNSGLNEKYVQICSVNQTVYVRRSKVVVWPTVSAETAKCTSNEHFTFPWGHRRGFVNGSEMIQLVTWQTQHGWCSTSTFHSYYTDSNYIEHTFLKAEKVVPHQMLYLLRQFAISDTAYMYRSKIPSQNLLFNSLMG